MAYNKMQLCIKSEILNGYDDIWLVSTTSLGQIYETAHKRNGACHPKCRSQLPNAMECIIRLYSGSEAKDMSRLKLLLCDTCWEPPAIKEAKCLALAGVRTQWQKQTCRKKGGNHTGHRDGFQESICIGPAVFKKKFADKKKQAV